MGERADRAEALFRAGCNCSQSVFVAFADLYGIDEKTAMKISASFGAGMGRMRETCGAFSGMLMVTGLETGAEESADQVQKGRNYEKVQELAARFRADLGTLSCRELLGLTEEDVKHESVAPAPRTADYYEKRPCPRIIHRAAEILEETYDFPGAGDGTQCNMEE